MPKLANQSEIDVSDDDDNVDLYSCQKSKKNKRKPLDFSIAQPKRYRNENISKEKLCNNEVISSKGSNDHLPEVSQGNFNDYEEEESDHFHDCDLEYGRDADNNFEKNYDKENEAHEVEESIEIYSDAKDLQIDE